MRFTFALLMLALGARAQQTEARLQLPGAPSSVETQEVSAALHTIFDIPDVAPDGSAFHVRGPAPSVRGGEWLIHDLEESEEIRRRAPHEYRFTGDKLPFVRALYLRSGSTPEHIQEILTTLRSVLNLPRTLTLTRPAAIILRATEPEAELASWLANELEHSPLKRQYSGIHQIRSSAGVVRIFYAENPAESNFAPVMKRVSSLVQRAYFLPSSSALIVRGSLDQVLAAEKLIGVR